MFIKSCSIITVATFIILTMISVSCRTEGGRTIDPCIPYDWYDDNTFRISSEGSPLPEEVNLVKKKNHARSMAVKKARIKLIELFIPPGGDADTLVDEYYAESIPDADSIMSIIMNGKVVHENYDQSCNCEIIYEISSPGLKKKLPAVTGK